MADPISSVPDAGRINELVAQHLPSLLAYVRVHSGTHLRAKESISDLVQSTCREVLMDARAVPEQVGAQFRYWLFTAAERKIRNKARHWRAERRAAVREVSISHVSEAEAQSVLECYRGFHTPSHDAMFKEEIARVEGALHELPEDYRDVIVLTYLVGMEPDAIAEKLERSPGAVRQLRAKALARLMRTLRQRAGETTTHGTAPDNREET